MSNNNNFKVNILDLSLSGKGVAKRKYDGFNSTIFVPYSAPKDELLVKYLFSKKFNITAKIVEILKPSIYRVEPSCIHYTSCGACNLLHIDYNYQLEFKKNKITELFARFDIPEHELILVPNPSPNHYRNRAKLFIDNNNKGLLKIGYKKQDNRGCLPLFECSILNPKITSYVANINSMDLDFSGGAIIIITCDDSCVSTSILTRDENQILEDLLSDSLDKSSSAAAMSTVPSPPGIKLVN